MTRPSENPLWAESAAADDIDEPTAERSSGYKDGEPFANAQANWIFRTFGRWIDWLGEGGSEPTVTEAIKQTDPGDTVVVDDYDPTLFFGQLNATASELDTGEYAVDIAADGLRIYVLTENPTSPGSARILSFDADDISKLTLNVIRTISDTSAWPASYEPCIVTDGEVVAATWDDGVVCHEVTGAERWTNFAGTPADTIDLTLSQDGVYAMADAGGEVTRLDRTNGTSLGDTGTALAGAGRGVACDGRGLYAWTYDSGVTESKIYRLTTTLGLYSGWSSNPVSVAQNGLKQNIEADGQRVIVGVDGGPRAWSTAGDLLYQSGYSPGPAAQYTYDDRFVYVFTTAEEINVFDIQTGERIAQLGTNESTLTDPASCLVSDGTRIFVCYESSNQIRRRTLARKPSMWRRVQASDAHRTPFQQLLLPAGG